MNDTEWSSRFFDESNKPTDRTVIILSMALIDDNLTELLKLHLKPSLANGDNDDPLFGLSRSISDIAPKIELAYRMGIIDKQVANIFKQFARMRNVAAHNPDGFLLSAPPNSDKIATLIDIVDRLGVESTHPELWVRIFTITIVGLMKNAITRMEEGAQDKSFYVSSAIVVDGGALILRSFPTKKHEMSIWDDC